VFPRPLRPDLHDGTSLDLLGDGPELVVGRVAGLSREARMVDDVGQGRGSAGEIGLGDASRQVVGAAVPVAAETSRSPMFYRFIDQHDDNISFSKFGPRNP